MVMRSFRDDWREAYVISNSYGMGDPLAPSEAEGGGITLPYLFEMTRPGASESKKRFHHHSCAVQLGCNLIFLRVR